MDGSQLFQLFFAGITTGSTYALIALGLTIILNSTDAVNVAQGEMVMIGGIIAVLLVKWLALPVFLAMIVAVVVVAAIGGVLYVVAIDPARNAPAMTLVMITLAASMIFTASAGLMVGYDPMVMPSSGSSQPFSVLGASVAPQVLWILVIAAATMIGLHQFYNRTKFGQAMLACNIDRDLAALVGINTRRMVLYSFVVGAAFAGLAGVLIVPLTSVSVFIGLTFTLKGFAAAVLGGLGKSLGAVIGGILLGLIEAFGSGLISTGYRDFIALSIILIILIVRPSGILGSRLGA